MILDEQSLRIIGKSFRWSEDEVKTFMGSHFKAIMDYTNKEALAYLAEEDPDRMKTINDLIESASMEDKTKGFYALHDQIMLMLTSYPDLQDKVTQVVKEYENSVLFDYLESGPVDGALELIRYLEDKVKKSGTYIDVLNKMKQRTNSDKVNDVLI
jgi:hypothetical protein